ncbi:MAG: Rv1733c family protein [Mycobacterium sp.]
MDNNPPVKARWWVLRAFGRNPLVRSSDRTEAGMLAFLLAVVFLAIPISLAFATGVHDDRTRALAAQTVVSREVSATVVDQTVTAVKPYALDVTANVTWRANGIEHTGSVDVPKPMDPGEQVQIWVDRTGRMAAPPATQGTATRDAVLAGVGAWTIVIASAAMLFAIIRGHLNRIRSLGWDRDIRHLVDDDGGRADWRS